MPDFEAAANLAVRETIEKLANKNNLVFSALRFIMHELG